MHGRAFGASGTKVAEVVFNTSLSGYQEIMTDPSYRDQMVCFTYPHIGNVGINDGDNESTQCHLEGIIIRDLSVTVSNYRATKTLAEFCKEQNVIGIADVDTRQLTRILREVGCLNGVITDDASKSDEELVEMANGFEILGKDLLSVVTRKDQGEWTQRTDEKWEFNPKATADPMFHVVAYDFGIKSNILYRLASLGCKITVVPAHMPASEVLAMKPDGVFLSNGPGDPSAATFAVENTKEILGKLPVFGICMGHQLLGQAFGGKTFKLSFGHHGGNHPIRDMDTGKIQISAQNHNYAIDPATLPEGVKISHINLNDGTCAGMRFPEQNALAIQYHPEASPGPHDADLCFDEFIDMMKASKTAAAQRAAIVEPTLSFTAVLHPEWQTDHRQRCLWRVSTDTVFCRDSR
eukprot:TRINITY_DN2547_c0_g1_i1.p1 TRINITY_DN2547_c0_g1~~TRINITY_DN2547_c0_g1_i1.p1  ORF type:complete len:408 (-),score=44.16 TRINITY_DN2547_c0_g1_i1:174-1397(-)